MKFETVWCKPTSCLLLVLAAAAVRTSGAPDPKEDLRAVS